MKPLKTVALLLALTFSLTACATNRPEETTKPQPAAEGQSPVISADPGVIHIVLSDNGITADGAPVGTTVSAPLYTAHDIVYYESGKDFTYGEGTEDDCHTADEAAAHTVLHIAAPGTYNISGQLSMGQIAVDLGDEAEDDPSAVVTLILNGVDITCTVAPAVIFYNVYECGSDDADDASKDVDTSSAGANVIIADGSVNTINGSYVAKIYEPDSVVLNDRKTKVKDADKLHKYDGAFYSRRSMNIFGGPENTGILNICAENEGLDSELHLTVNGGNIFIDSGNDGINTNEDGVSVTTVNGGNLTIRVNGQTGEGDGIDSNGWLVINGGTVLAAACSTSADAGIDSDMGIHINGGTVIATGHMLDEISESGQNYAILHFSTNQTGAETLMLKNQSGDPVLETAPGNAYSVMIFSSPNLVSGAYTLWRNGDQLAAASGMMPGRPGMPPGGADHPQHAGDKRPPDGNQPFHPGTTPTENQATSPELIIRDGGNQFLVAP